MSSRYPQRVSIAVNDSEVTQKAIEIAENYLGKEHIVSLAIRTTAEDFSYFLQQVPGTFFRVSSNPRKGITSFTFCSI